MKIDFIIGSLKGGGAERVVCTLANYLANKGYKVRIITFKDGSEKYKLDEKVIRLKFHSNFKILNYTLFRTLIYLFKFYIKKSNRPNIVSAHIGLMGLPTIPIAKLLKIKIVISEHINHSATIVNLEKKILWNIFYKYADAITILTKYDLPFFKNKNKNVNVIHNPNSFPPIKSINENREKNIIAIGSLDRYHHKGFDNLIDIAEKIKYFNPEWKFHIIGEGEYGRKILDEKINKLNLLDTVYLKGFRSDICEILRNSSIFILPSRFEGLPMALIEASSQGIACISYDCISGPSEIIEDGFNGILIEDQNHDEMAKQIMSLINNKELRNYLGANAIKTSNKFSIEKIGLKWEKLFESINLN